MDKPQKSTLSRSETLEHLNEILDMSDGEIAMNSEYIRHAATSAHNHIARLRAKLDKAKRQNKTVFKEVFRG